MSRWYAAGEGELVSVRPFKSTRRLCDVSAGRSGRSGPAPEGAYRLHLVSASGVTTPRTAVCPEWDLGPPPPLSVLVIQNAHAPPTRSDKDRYALARILQEDGLVDVCQTLPPPVSPHKHT
jgi:hypothetical protein